MLECKGKMTQDFDLSSCIKATICYNQIAEKLFEKGKLRNVISFSHVHL